MVNLKIAEIETLRNEINTNNNASNLENCKPGEKIMVAHFISCDQRINKAFACKNTDTFIRIEEKLYKEFPDYINNHTFFTVGGVMIYRFKTMEDNKIKDGDKIMLCY